MSSPTTERSVVEVLRAAKERIRPLERWTQGSFATTERGGSSCPPNDPAASCWCAAGSVLAELDRNAQGFYVGLPEYELLLRSARDLGERTPEMVNDEIGHAAVLAMFDRAIAAAEANQS